MTLADAPYCFAIARHAKFSRVAAPDSPPHNFFTVSLCNYPL